MMWHNLVNQGPDSVMNFSKINISSTDKKQTQVTHFSPSYSVLSTLFAILTTPTTDLNDYQRNPLPDNLADFR